MPGSEKEKPLWERFPGESDKAYEAFCCYRDMGPSRSVDKAYQYWRSRVSQEDESQNGRRAGVWLRWSGRHRWRVRTEAYDSYLDGRSREAREEERLVRERSHAKELEDLRQMQYQTAKGLYSIAIKFLKKNMERVEQMQAEDVDLKNIANNIRAIAEACAKAQTSLAEAAGIEDILDNLSIADE